MKTMARYLRWVRTHPGTDAAGASPRRPARVAALALAFLALACWPTPGPAALIFQATPDSTTSPGSGFFDVTLTNTNAGPVAVAGFDFQVSVNPGSGVTFDDATTTTGISGAPTYIFVNGFADAFSGGDVAVNTLPATSVLAADSAVSGFRSIASGATFGLARISYSVALGQSPGVIPVIFDFADLSGPGGAAIPGIITTNGAITIIPVAPGPAVVPEPATLVMGLTGVLGLLGYGWRRRQWPA
jgi:hypothetical protein